MKFGLVAAGFVLLLPWSVRAQGADPATRQLIEQLLAVNTTPAAVQALERARDLLEAKAIRK